MGYTRLGDEFVVEGPQSSQPSDSTITSLPSGGFVVSWVAPYADGSGFGIKAQIYDASGIKVGSEFLVNTSASNDQQAPTIASLASGGFVVSWEDKSGTGGDASGFSVKAQIFDASGNKVGSEFLVNTTTLNDQWHPTITSLASGGFVVSWQEGRLPH